MTIATGSRHSLFYVEEVTYGTTPAIPAFEPICITGTSIGMTRDAIEAGCLSSDRQLKDVRNGNKQVGGGIESELIFGVHDDFLEAALMGTWATDVLLAQTTRRSFTIERWFPGIDVPEYHRSTGIELSGFELSVSPNAYVTMNYTAIGQELSPEIAQIAGATYAATSANVPYDSFTGEILEGGAAIAVVTQLDLSLDNGMEPTFAVFNDTTLRPTDGKSRITGTLTAYYESRALYQKFINGTNSSIVFTLTDPDGNDYLVELPNIKYTGGNPDVSGEGPVTLALACSAIYDPATTSQIKITRTAA